MPDQYGWLARQVDGANSAVVVSPHLDDAVLSCGALLAYLARRCPITVLTVFTAAAPPVPLSLAARRQLSALGVTDAEVLFEQRRAEDIAVLAEVGATVVHLGLRDALFRRVGEAAVGPPGPGRRPAYPTFRFHAGRGRIAPSETGLHVEVSARIGEVIPASGARVVFAPLGIGRHVDHLITRQAVQSLGPRTIYYSDFPYSETAVPDQGFIQRAALVPHPWLLDRAENANRIAGYKTQFLGLFPHGTVPTRPEIYWIPAKDSATAA